MPGQPVHIEIPADDTAKGQKFWGSLFGWKFQAFPGPFEYHMGRISDQAGVAITNMEAGKRGIRTYFDVDDTQAGAKRVNELFELGSAPGEEPICLRLWLTTARDCRLKSLGKWKLGANPCATCSTLTAASGKERWRKISICAAIFSMRGSKRAKLSATSPSMDARLPLAQLYALLASVTVAVRLPESSC